jgi:hypothetical protein
VSHLGEEAEAFFKKGDEGTYEGGPLSMMPSSVDCPALGEEDENLTTELIAGQLERRSRMQRLVTKIVGGLGVGVLLLVPARSWVGRAAGGTSAESLAVIAPRAHAAPLPLAEVPKAAELPVAAPELPAAAPPPLQDRPAAPVAAAPVESAPPAAKARNGSAGGSGVLAASTGHKPHGSAVHSQQQGNRSAVFATRPTRTFASVPLSSSVHRSSGSHAPPTANFPD